jgi:hypothetical protein
VGVGVLEYPLFQLRECPDFSECHLLKVLPIGLNSLIHVVVIMSIFPEARTEILKLVVHESSLFQQSDILLKVRFRTKFVTLTHKPNERFSHSLTL